MFSKKQKGPKISPLQKKETVFTLERLITNIAEGLSMLTGLENQLNNHIQVIDILEEELQALASTKAKVAEIAYSPQELHKIEECLVDINDVVTRLHPAAYTDTGVLLKEIRTLISLGYERQNLLIVMINLTNLLLKIEVFNQNYGQRLTSNNLTNSKSIKIEMKKDENLLIPILKDKFNELKQLKPDTTDVINEGLQFLEAGTKIMSVFDALDIKEITEIDRMVRRLIVEDEADIAKEHLHLDDASLGEGAFGYVDSATFRIPNKKNKFKVALKTLKLSDELLKDEYIELSNEVAKMKVLESPFIVYCYGLSLRPNHVHIVFERMDVSLYDYLYEDLKTLNAKQFLKLAGDVSLGLLQLHLLNLTHRNLSAKNVMFSPRKWEDPIKIMDYGCGLSKYSAHTKGPTVYTPPEVFTALKGPYTHSGWSTKGDIYSLGLVLWESCQKENPPFKEDVYNLEKVVGRDKKVPPMKLKATDETWVKKLISSCIQAEPGFRPNAKDVCDTIFTYSKKKGKKQLKDDLLAVKETVKNTPSSYVVNPGNVGERKSHLSTSSPVALQPPVLDGPSQINIVGNQVKAAGDFIAPPPRGGMASLRVDKNTRTTQAPPGLAPPTQPRHRPQLPFQQSFEQNKSRPPPPKPRSQTVEEEEDEAVFDDDNFYEEERDGANRSDEGSICSRGPEPEEVEDARDQGTLVQLAIETCSNPKKLSRKVKKLKEDILDEDNYDFSSLFSRVQMKKKIADIDCQVIGLLVRWNKYLVRLNLEFNNITDDGIADLATGMRTHPSLLQIYLGGNSKITEINPLVKKLKKNSTIEVLGLDACSISNDGARKIGQLLASTTCRLVELDLSGNKIGNQGMRYLAKGLEGNTQLQALIVSDQTINCSKGIKELKKVAKKIKLPLNKRL